MRQTNQTPYRRYLATDKANATFALSNSEVRSATPFDNVLPLSGFFGVSGAQVAVLDDGDGIDNATLTLRIFGVDLIEVDQKTQLGSGSSANTREWLRRPIADIACVVGTATGVASGVFGSTSYKYVDTMVVTLSAWGTSLAARLGLESDAFVLAHSPAGNAIAEFSIPDLGDTYGIIIDIDGNDDADISGINLAIKLGG